ncbi:lysM domain receptor-like kinase 3 [Dorcoceras hygrometricum]|uniref:LysM domain receptor-like kinase 3 n=1 Tax=Dorcoceras hygrometricum TaxID=472368 RepID=A0A2Z7D011_9LAMI|nr:lysM domain receptor-like kinase 3 [Dorcoceras hygrometricum]
MASKRVRLLSFLLLVLLFRVTKASSSDQKKFPFPCSAKIQSCNALLYQKNGLQEDEIASLYSVNKADIKIIKHGNKQDYLVPVNCSCRTVEETVGYFYDVIYNPESNTTLLDVSNGKFSGQAWDGGIDRNFTGTVSETIHLLCGCVDDDSQVVVTYTVQDSDTVYTISVLLSAQSGGLESLNSYIASNPSSIHPGWILYVPMEKYGIPAEKKEKFHRETIIVTILSAVTLLSICTLAIILFWRKKNKAHNKEVPEAFSKNLSAQKSDSLKKQYLRNHKLEDITAFGSEKPSCYNIDEIAEATSDFDESRIIGRGGFGNVYHGVIGEKEVAIKKMRSNKSKEFLAELKVLCKIHHINVVELLGYASGNDHLYLVYEYIQNGSLNDHLHSPSLKGHQPLSWTTRMQIALDAAKGIEYIHDHTKAQYVHRDIKTANILLDEGLRAKVADFGLAKLVGRTNEDELIATRLVGTPGYLPPEAVKELQVTTKTDVFAFGVVLSELITGQRALVRDNKEPSRMKSLVTEINRVFHENDPESALELIIDANLKGNYPPEDVYKMAEVAKWCLGDDPLDRPEIREVVVALARIRMSSIEWEASLGGNSQIFSGVFIGR